MDSTVMIFLLVFASQIFLVSIWYPRRFAAQINWIADNLPANAYPGLYPDGPGAYTPARARGALPIFLGLNTVIAVAGVAILALVGVSDYDPSPKGGDEIFVFFFFMVQMIPWFIAEISVFRHARRMREQGVAARRSTDLKPRRLSDYIAPGWVGLAIALFVIWAIYYITGRMEKTGEEWEIWLTFASMISVNLLYGFLIWRAINGGKRIPNQSRDDQDRMIGIITKVGVFGSCANSLFLMLTQFADEYALELWDPVFTSLFFQLIIFVGMGHSYRSIRMEELDFEPWRKPANQT